MTRPTIYRHLCEHVRAGRVVQVSWSAEWGLRGDDMGIGDSNARHTSVMSTMPTRPASPTTGRCRKWPLVMTLAAPRTLVVVLMTTRPTVISTTTSVQIGRAHV